ncbi:hypothetical protein K3495_g3614 [Podosphaera aphanis]|nr:hypothetical protein K3495_g3614 [Podosphaera aphanis]
MKKEKALYGCVSTGELTIFLKVPKDNFKVVKYYFSIPEYAGDEGPGMAKMVRQTVFGEMVAFTLQAVLNLPPVPVAADRDE